MKMWIKGLMGIMAIALAVTPLAPAFAQKTTPATDRVVNVPAVPRTIPDLMPYHKFDPPKSPLFDINKLTISGDMRVRPELRTNACFGGRNAGANVGCTFSDRVVTGAAAGAGNNIQGRETKTNDFFATQLARLGISYDISPDVNFFFQPQYAKVWGASSDGNGANDPGNTSGNSLFVRQAYMLIRNLGGVQNLSFKGGRQLIVWGNHRLLGHFDWANVGFAFDAATVNYTGKNWDVFGGWARVAESDAGAAANAPGFSTSNIATGTDSGTDASNDADLFMFKGNYKPGLWGMVVEPYWIFLMNNAPTSNILAPRAANQNRHSFGARTAWRTGPTNGMMFDGTGELVWQTGTIGAPDGSGAAAGNNTAKNLGINALAFAGQVGLTFGNVPTDPRIGFEVDYATGDGDSNQCNANVGGNATANCGGNANLFENLFPTNHIHYGYMDTMAWRNMVDYQLNFQNRPTANSHFEFAWHINMRLASRNDNWYRASQGVYFQTQPGNQKASLGSEIDIMYTHFFQNNKVGWQTGYGHFFPGEYVTQQANLAGTGRVNAQDWLYTSLWVNF